MPTVQYVSREYLEREYGLNGCGDVDAGLLSWDEDDIISSEESELSDEEKESFNDDLSSEETDEEESYEECDSFSANEADKASDDEDEFYKYCCAYGDGEPIDTGGIGDQWKYLRRNIEQNVSWETNLRIVDSTLPSNGTLDGEFGAMIGRNTCLREVRISLRSRSLGLEFFRGVASNRSIVRLVLRGLYHLGDKVLPSLIPFFENNKNFKCLCIKNCGEGEGKGSLETLASTLGKFDSLKDFKFIDNCCPYKVDESTGLIEALSGHDLRKIIIHGVQLGRDSCAALAALLHKPRSKLRVLDVWGANICDEGAIALSSGLSRNTTLEELNLGGNLGIKERGWQAISEALRSPTCRLTKLILISNCIKDEAAISLADALRSRNTLKTLHLIGINRITIAGIRHLFVGLFHNPLCTLDSVNCVGCGLNDELVQTLTTALVHNSRLRELNISANWEITPAGWQSFAPVLRNPNSALDKLDVSHNPLGDQVMISFAEALANNKKMRVLKVVVGDNEIDNRVTSAGYAAFTQLLCNTSSILDTYNSNHTLDTLCDEYGIEEAEDLLNLLRVNYENSDSQAARIKIKRTHFCGRNINTQIFIGMEVAVLPTAIAWMGQRRRQDGRQNESSSLMFAFLRRMPSLCDTTGRNKKRKIAD